MSGGTTQPMASGPETLGGGRYHLHRRLGVGGMGIVMQATDTRLGREVAVKLLADNLAADETARERFLREARAAASVSDPHVVQVHDVDEEAGRPFLVMELVDGPSLGDVLATSGPLDPEDVADVAADALAGLRRAHDTGLLHRDLKPGNLLRTPDGLVKVTDFGVARAADAPELTRTGMVIGTAPYLAPERAAGQAATTRTDLYALGVTLHELLTGRRPSDEAATEPWGEEVPATLSHLLDRLLADDPQQRPASAGAALAILAGEVDTPTRADQAVAPAAARDGVAATPAAPADDIIDASVPAAGRSADTADLASDADEARAPAGRPSAVSWSVVVAVAVALLLVAVGFQLVTGGDEEAPPPGVERSEDPAETARNLAEWLRDRAGE